MHKNPGYWEHSQSGSPFGHWVKLELQVPSAEHDWGVVESVIVIVFRGEVWGPVKLWHWQSFTLVTTFKT